MCNMQCFLPILVLSVNLVNCWGEYCKNQLMRDSLTRVYFSCYATWLVRRCLWLWKGPRVHAARFSSMKYRCTFVNKAESRLAPRHHYEGAASHVGHFERSAANRPSWGGGGKLARANTPLSDTTRPGYTPEVRENEKLSVAAFLYRKLCERNRSLSFVYFIYLRLLPFLRR